MLIGHIFQNRDYSLTYILFFLVVNIDLSGINKYPTMQCVLQQSRMIFPNGAVLNKNVDIVDQWWFIILIKMYLHLHQLYSLIVISRRFFVQFIEWFPLKAQNMTYLKEMCKRKTQPWILIESHIVIIVQTREED